MRNLIVIMLLLSVVFTATYAKCDTIDEVCDDDFYDKGHNSEETFEDDGIIYSSKYYSERMVVLYVDNDKYIIDGECSCERSDDTKYMYCIDEIETVEEDIDDGKLDKVKFVNGKAREYIEFVFCEAKPAMDIEYDEDNNKPNLNDIVKIHVKMENVGVKAAYKPKLTLPIPQGLTLVSTPDIKFDGENAYYELEQFSPYRKVEIDIKLRVVNTGTYTLRPTFSYTYEGENIEKKDTMKITVVAPYDVDVDAPGTTSLDEQFDLEINIENELDEQNIKVEEFIVTLPEGVQVYEDYTYTADDWQLKEINDFAFETTDNKVFTFSGAIPKGEKFKHIMRLVATKEGKQIIETKYKMNAKNQVYEEIETDVVNVKSYLVPEIDFSVTEEVEGGKEYWVRVSVENKDKNVDFSDLKLRLTSDITRTEDITKKDIPRDKEIVLFNEYYKTDEVIEEEKYSFILTGSFKDANGEIYTVKEEEELTIIPPRANITITINPSKDTIVPGEEFSIEVLVKNLENVYVGTVRGNDNVPPELEITGGRMAASISLEKNEQKQLYKYKVLVPQTYKEKEILITTDVITQIGSKTFSNEKTLTLQVDTSSVMVDGQIINADEYFQEETTQKNQTQNQTIIVNETTTQDDNNGTTIVNEKQGFFSRMLTKIGSWLDKLF